MKELLTKAKPHLLALLVILMVSVIYFYPQLQGKVINQDDITAGIGMKKEAMDYQEQSGKVALWTNSMFGGMPTYQISAPQKSNLIRSYVEPLLQLKLAHPISWFFVGGLSFYILLIVMGLNHWLASLGALCFAFTTNQLLLYDAGHTSKFRALTYLPMIIAGVYLLLEKRKWLGGTALFLLGAALNVSANHYQMTYYFAIGMGLFMLVYLGFAAYKGELVPYLKAAAIMLVCGIVAVGPSASKIMTTLEYAQETMRGKSQLKEEASQRTDQSVNKEGLQWSYAMMWSYAPRDLMSTFIPGAVGGSSGEPVGDSYTTGKLFGARGDKKANVPMYWGGAESVAGPMYYGAIVFFLFILGLLTVRNTALKYALLAAVVIVSMLSMGKYFESFQRIFFEHFPKYSNFRAHNSAMGVVAVLIPVLGFLGLHQFLNGKFSKEELKKNLLYAVYFVGGLVLFLIILGPSFFNFEHMQDARFLQMMQGDQNSFNQFIQDLADDRQKMLRNSSIRSLIFVLLSAGTLWMYINGKVKKQVVIYAIGGLALFDIVSVDWKYLNHDDFENKTVVKQNYRPRAVDQRILQMEPRGRGYYRVFDISKGVNTFSSSSGSYFYNTVGGYSAVKLQRIQDVIDSIFVSGVNIDVINMLNTKYLITGENAQLQVNPEALGNAWFVNDIKWVNSATDELRSLRNFNAAEQAIVHEEWRDKLQGFNPPIKDSSSTTGIELVEYSPMRLVYKANSAEEQLAVFSEIWYGPNLGWKAYINGEPAEHFRVNYLLRGMKVPAGQDTEIVFEFEPDTYIKGERISMASSILILLLVIGWIGFSLKPYLAKN